MVPGHNLYSVDVMTLYHRQQYVNWGPRMCDLTHQRKKPWRPTTNVMLCHVCSVSAKKTDTCLFTHEWHMGKKNPKAPKDNQAIKKRASGGTKGSAPRAQSKPSKKRVPVARGSSLPDTPPAPTKRRSTRSNTLLKYYLARHAEGWEKRADLLTVPYRPFTVSKDTLKSIFHHFSSADRVSGVDKVLASWQDLTSDTFYV